MVANTSTAKTTLPSWKHNKFNLLIRNGNITFNNITYPKFPFSILIAFHLTVSQLYSISGQVGSFVADQQVENMCLEDQSLFCKHCCIILVIQRINIAQGKTDRGWVPLTKVTSIGHITSSNTNLDQIPSSDYGPSINFKISTKHQQLDLT